jgi:hypothetical protein
MMESTAQSSLVQRMIRAARLEPDLYEEVEADQNATTGALTVVAIVAVAGGIGNAIAARSGGPLATIVSLIVGVVLALLGWVVWSYLTYFIGTKLFSGIATPGELLRTLGFAQAPGVLNILRFVPVIGVLISIVAGIWVLVAGVVAVRQALDFDTGKAILTTIIGGVVVFAVTAILTAISIGAMVALSR